MFNEPLPLTKEKSLKDKTVANYVSGAKNYSSTSLFIILGILVALEKAHFCVAGSV